MFELQSRLDDLGLNVGRCDGIFGRSTEDALRQYQSGRGLINDGCCGPVTLRALTAGS